MKTHSRGRHDAKIRTLGHFTDIDGVPQLTGATVMRNRWPSPGEMQALWTKTEHLPFLRHPPYFLWAYRAIAKFVGWIDSKRKGRIGLDTL